MLLSERELNLSIRVLVGSFFDSLRKRSRTAEVGLNFRFQLRPGSRQVLPRLYCLPNLRIDSHPIGPAERRPGSQERKRIIIRSRVINRDIIHHVFADFLRQVDIDPQEVWIGLRRFHFLEQGLEPPKGGSITAHPEELYPA